MVGGSSGLVGAIGNSSDRIQLAPLRAAVATGGGANAAAGMSDSSPGLTHGLPDHRSNTVPSTSSSGSAGAAYPVMHLQGNGRSAYDAARDDRDDRGERDHERLEGRTGKKNLLSIGSIISNEE